MTLPSTSRRGTGHGIVVTAFVVQSTSSRAISCDDNASSRAEAMADTTVRHHAALRERLGAPEPG